MRPLLSNLYAAEVYKRLGCTMKELDGDFLLITEISVIYEVKLGF